MQSFIRHLAAFDDKSQAKLSQHGFGFAIELVGIKNPKKKKAKKTEKRKENERPPH